MSVSRFVQPGTVRLPLSGGDWIEIKRLLSVGDQKRVNGSGMRHIVEGDKVEVKVDFAETSFTRTLAYLVGWSFLDDQGQPVKITRSSVESLTTDAYGEIEAAINGHVEDIALAKKTQDGGAKPSTS